LAQKIDIRVEEQASGGVAVFAGESFLVFEGIKREVKAEAVATNGLSTTSILMSETNAPLNSSGGELAGLVLARDQIAGDFIDNIDDFARALTF